MKVAALAGACNGKSTLLCITIPINAIVHVNAAPRYACRSLLRKAFIEVAKHIKANIIKIPLASQPNSIAN